MFAGHCGARQSTLTLVLLALPARNERWHKHAAPKPAALLH
jgi:hypothetical protein